MWQNYNSLMNSAHSTTSTQQSKPSKIQRSQKVQDASMYVLKMAYHLGPGAQMPTFASLCSQTGVSKATLDSALGQLETQGIISRRQGAGIYVTSELKRSIALVCDPKISSNPGLSGFWELIVREAQLRVAGSQYELAFHFSTMEADSASDEPPLHAGLIDDIAMGRVQGVLAVDLTKQAVEWMNEQGVAVVELAGMGRFL
jgi:DNA-binding transcriptional regulator YhcF (GntR family)